MSSSTGDLTLHLLGYGEVEFWYSICKLLLVFILILMSFFFMIGVNPHHETFGFRVRKASSSSPLSCWALGDIQFVDPDFAPHSTGTTQGP